MLGLVGHKSTHWTSTFSRHSPWWAEWENTMVVGVFQWHDFFQWHGVWWGSSRLTYWLYRSSFRAAKVFFRMQSEHSVHIYDMILHLVIDASGHYCKYHYFLSLLFISTYVVTAKRWCKGMQTNPRCFHLLRRSKLRRELLHSWRADHQLLRYPRCRLEVPSRSVCAFEKEILLNVFFVFFASMIWNLTLFGIRKLYWMEPTKNVQHFLCGPWPPSIISCNNFSGQQHEKRLS